MCIQTWKWLFVDFFMLLSCSGVCGLIWLFGRDEGLLAQSLELNDSLQGVLARHDGIAAGTPLPNHKKDASLQQSATPDSNAKTTEVRDKTPVENGKSPAFDPPGSKALAEVEEEEDEFALLTRRLFFLNNLVTLHFALVIPPTLIPLDNLLI